MKPISILKKSPAPPATAPARAALAAHMAAIAALGRQRQELAERDTAARRDVEAAHQLEAEISALGAAIDQAEADARYAGTPPPALTVERAALAAAQAKHGRLASVSRAAAIAHRRYAADMAELTRQQTDLSATVPQLLHAALMESIGDYRQEFEEAERLLLAARRKAFTAALAADQVALVHKFGVFCGSALYGELNITRPSSYESTYADDFERGRALEAAHVRWREDLKKLEADAEKYANRFLSAE